MALRCAGRVTRMLHLALVLHVSDYAVDLQEPGSTWDLSRAASVRVGPLHASFCRIHDLASVTPRA